MGMFPESPLYYVAFCAVTVMTLKEVNEIVWEPYMDEPFHVPQAQAYCNGDWTTWDPKITTPPGLYVIASVLRNVFMFKCKLPLLRLVPTLHLLAIPPLIARLEAYYKRLAPSSDITQPSLFAVTLALCPIAWFFGFLFYTDVPGLAFVLAAFVAQANDNPWLSAILGLVSISFRQTNVIWIVYIFAYDQVLRLRWQRNKLRFLHDPPALSSSLDDFLQMLASLPQTLWNILPQTIPVLTVSFLFGVFVVWNGGIVLGDKSNHVPSVHVPQLFYFYAFASFLGWPVLLFGGRGSLAGPLGLFNALHQRMLGSTRARIQTIASILLMVVLNHFFIIHHPFILSDNRHYTFYIWKRIIFVHWLAPYLLTPVYLTCFWAWWIRISASQSLLQALLLPMALFPVLVPTPLLEFRYFIIPYLLMRLQAAADDEETPESWAHVLLPLELIWYICLNGITMSVFLYYSRETLDGTLRFMW